MKVHIVCMRWNHDRILPRYSRYLRDGLGWTLSDSPDNAADVNYYVNYADGWKRYGAKIQTRLAAHFTHKEESGGKVRMWDACADACDLRTAVSLKYAAQLEPTGKTIIARAPVDDFALRTKYAPNDPVRVGVSGFAASPRKGAVLIQKLADSHSPYELVASGRGWPIPTTIYPWSKMEGFLHSLDIMLCPSLIEAGPGAPLEALRCGVPVVVPWDVGVMGELPEIVGIRHYAKGDYDDMRRALEVASGELTQVDPQALRATVSAYTVENWCAAHEKAFRETFG